MGGQFAAILILDAHEQIHLNLLKILFLLQLRILLFPVLLLSLILSLFLHEYRYLTILVLNFLLEKNSSPKRIHIGELISTGDVLVAVTFGLAEG
jgi:hypothetical protein